MSDLPEYELRQILPEQMERDPSGKLARITHDALLATAAIPQPDIRVICVCDGRSNLIAWIGLTDHGWLYVAPMERWEGGTIVHDDLTGTMLVDKEGYGKTFPFSAKQARSGVIRPVAEIALLNEPAGFPPPPSGLPARCRRCGDRSVDRAMAMAVTRDIPQRKKPWVVQVRDVTRSTG